MAGPLRLPLGACDKGEAEVLESLGLLKPDLFNRQNMPMQRNNKSGEPGVRRRQDTGRWTAEIQVDGRVHRLGCFDSKDDAIRSRRRAKLQFHPFGAEGALDGG